MTHFIAFKELKEDKTLFSLPDFNSIVFVNHVVCFTKNNHDKSNRILKNKA